MEEEKEEDGDDDVEEKREEGTDFQKNERSSKSVYCWNYGIPIFVQGIASFFFLYSGIFKSLIREIFHNARRSGWESELTKKYTQHFELSSLIGCR